MLNKILTVAKYTYLEIIKSRILYATLGLGLFVAISSFVASSFTYGTPERVALDFGVGVFSLSAIGIAIFMGATLISREIESRTVYLALSRSISRFSFLLGKIAGLSLVLAVNILLLGLVTYTVVFLLGGQFEGIMVWVVCFSFLEAFLLLNVVVLFSLLTNVPLAIFYTLVVYIVGHSIPTTLETSVVSNNPWLEYFIKIYSYFFPNLTVLNYRDFLTYSIYVPTQSLFLSLVYGIGYCSFLIFLSAWMFSKRELN